MRIVIARHFLHVVGGAETHLQTLLPLLQAAGHEIAVVYEEHLAGRDTIIDQVPDVSRWQISPATVDTVLDEIRRWEPDVVYSHALGTPELDSRLVEAFPTILFAHAYYGTCISGAKHFQRPAIEPCHRTFGPGCLWRYLPLGCGGNNPVTMLKLYNEAVARHRNLSRYRAIIVGSRHMYQEYLQHGIPADRLFLAPLFPSGMVRDEQPPQGRVVTGKVLFVSRLSENKGWRHLIDAMASAQPRLDYQLSLVVAGDGPDREKMAARAQQKHILISFLGWIGREQLTSVMRRVDLLAVPSLWPEPFGMVGVEAACVGLPSVGYEVGGITDWLIPGVTGELAPGRHPNWKELGRCIEVALSSDQYLHQLRVGAWRESEKFSAASHVSIINQVLSL